MILTFSEPLVKISSPQKINLTFLRGWHKIQIEKLPVQLLAAPHWVKSKRSNRLRGRLGGYFFLLLQMMLMTCKNKPQIPTITSTSCSTSEALIGMALLSQRAINKTKAPSGASHMERRTVRGNRQLHWHCLHYSIFWWIPQHILRKKRKKGRNLT